MTTILNRDDVRGHFHMTGLDGAPGKDVGEVTGVDLGPVLHLQCAAAHLTPSDARLLAEALTWWADRKHPDEAPGLGDLLDLLGDVS